MRASLFRVVLLVVLASAALLIPSATPAMADPLPEGATCAVVPNPVAVGASYTLSGRGYLANEPLSQWVQNTVGGVLYTMQFAIDADASGAFSFQWHADAVGEHTVTIYHRKVQPHRGSLIVLTACAFTAS